MFSKKIVKFAVIPILIFAFLAPSLMPFAEGFSFPDRYDLVAILVEQGIYEDPADYEAFDETTLKARVDRYAVDLQNALPGTRAIIIQVDRFEKTENIAAVLERLYVEGDPKEPNRTAYLKGIVIVGEVPLPVVNKSGTRFISLFPYTDFEEKIYAFNSATRDFEAAGRNTNPQPEIWHGVITPPQSTQTPQGKQMIAAYFDKNHLYHIGDENFTTFDKKILFQDFWHEAKNLNPIAYKNYLNFLNHQGDVAYMRYTKKLYKDLAGPIEEEALQDEEETQEAMESLDEFGIQMDTNIPLPEGINQSGESSENKPVDKNKIPDIMTKIGKMSDKLMFRFNQIFLKYPNLINDFMKYTGRYIDPQSGLPIVDSAINLITTKDQFTLDYLKAVNAMVEERIDDIAANKLQNEIPIGQEVEIKLQSAQVKTANGTTKMSPMGDPPSYKFTSVSPKFLNAEFTFFADFINGWEISEVESIAQCSLYRGSKGTGEYSKLVKATREFDLMTTKDFYSKNKDSFLSGRTPDEKEAGYNCYTSSFVAEELRGVCDPVQYPTFATCLFVKQKEALEIGGTLCPQYQNIVIIENQCFIDNNDAACSVYKEAIRCFFNEPGLAQYTFVDNEKKSPYKPNAPASESCEAYEHFGGCFYGNMGQPADEIPATSPQMCFPEQATDPVFDIAGAVEVEGSPPANYDNFKACADFHEKEQYIKYLNAVNTLLEVGDDKYSETPTEKIKRLNNDFDFGKLKKNADPDSQTIYDMYDVTLGDVLRGLGWDSKMDSASFSAALSDLLFGNSKEEIKTVNISHPEISQVELKLNRTFKKTIPSIFYHKEPTALTLNAQAKNMVSPDLPVDSPRYVTFQDASGKVARITYPDLFSEDSFDSYLAKLKDIEKQINAIPRDPNDSPLPCESCLTSLVSQLPEIAKEGSKITRANKSKVSDTLQWKNMDLNAKHAYLSEYYLDPVKNAYIGESQNGYEMLYYNGEGSAAGYDFSFDKIKPEGGGVVEEFVEDKEEPFDDDPNNPFDDPSEEQKDTGYDLFSWSPPPVSPWWERVKEWKDKQKEILNSYKFGASDKEFYDKLDNENKKTLEKIQKESDAVWGDPTKADELELSRIEKVELDIDSTLVSSGKKIGIGIKLKDKSGELVNDEFAKLTLVIEGAAAFESAAQDDEPDTPGLQITMASGTKNIAIVADKEGGAIKLTAQLAGSDKKAELSLAAIKGAQLSLQAPVSSIIADGKTFVSVGVSAVDEAGQILTEAGGKVSLGLSNPAMAKLGQKEINLVNGKGVFGFVVGKRKGDLLINAASNLFDSGSLLFKLLPDKPVKMILSADPGVLEVKPGAQVKVTASLYDANDNFVNTNSAAKIDLRLSDSTKIFGSLSGSGGQVKDGAVSVNLYPTENTGDVEIIAESAGFPQTSIIIKAVKRFGQEDVSNMQPQALVAALLGIPAGDTTHENYLGGWFIMNGKVQAAATLTNQPKEYKRLFELTSSGGLKLGDASRITAQFLPANNFTMLLHDNTLQEDLAQITIYTFKDGQFDVTDIPDIRNLNDGIFLKKIIDDENYKVDRAEGALRVVKGDSEKIEVQTNGYTRIFDNSFSLKPVNGEFLTLQVLDKDTPVAEIYFVQRFNQDVKLLEEGEPDSTGVYVKPLTNLPNIFYNNAFSGNSTSESQGFVFYDKTEEVSGSAAPGFSFSSFEDSLKKIGIGFSEDNKFALLFSSGETFGEANRPYSSDIGIVLGDPTVRINNKKEGGFSSDIGKLVYAGSSDVRGLISFDYNTDGFEDILIVEDKGKVRLIQNNGGYDQLKDQGFILDVKNGIQDFDKVDFNNDEQMDFVIAGKVSCRKGDTCVDIYENREGEFVRNNLHFNETAKIVTVRAHDVNGDDFADLILADANGDIKVIYNREGKFDEQAQEIGNVGLTVDPQKNLIKSVLLNYAGMDSKKKADPDSAQKYKMLNGTNYIYADLDTAAFSKSTKTAEDLNGGVLKEGDRVRYTITLKNDSAATKNNVIVSDVISDQVELDTESSDFEMEQFGAVPGRPYIFKNINVPPKSSKKIVYEAVFKADTATSDKIKIIFTDNKIGVTKEGNTTGQMRYFYSTGVDKNNNLIWSSDLSDPPEPPSSESFKEKTGLGSDMDPNEEIEENKPPKFAEAKLQELQTKDSDNDGLQDSIDDINLVANKALDGLGDFTQAAVNKLTCDAGCVALPVNAAFLAPGFWSYLGTPNGYDIGTPVFGWGAPFITTTYPPMPAMSTAGGRIYISPTLTGGVGFSVCLGKFLPPGPPKNCFSFGVNPLELIDPNICNSLSHATSSVMAAANDAISKINEGVTVSLGGGNGVSVGAGARENEGSGLANYSLGNYSSPVSKSVNIRIPGFPDVLTDWYSRQMEEIADKALAIPDIYLIYPKGTGTGSVLGAFTPTSPGFSQTGDFLTDLLTYINSIPLIDIQTEEVLFKIPMLTKKEIERVKADALQWVEDEKLELDKWRTLIGCVGIPVGKENNFANPELCKFITLEMNKMMSSVIANVKALDEWLLFPKKILQFRTIEAFYLNQIIDYLDTIIKFTGGWAKKNTAIVQQWRRAVRQIKKTIEDWKVLLDLMIDYNESCDTCQTERYGLKDMLLKLFIGIPAPPVIPLPKLPDIIVDVSKIQAGLKIQWPDVKFKPEPFIIPKLPRIGLGINLTLPMFKLMMPEIPVIPLPPKLPSLPALPALQLPQLPNLPPAPKVPGLPGQLKVLITILKKIVKILCIVKLGFTPTDEFLLKAKIEEITARGLTPLLPIDTLFTIQYPPITVTYIDQLIITAFTNFQMDLSYVQDIVEKTAEDVNAFSTDLTKTVNQFNKALFQQLQKITNPQLDINVPGPEGKQLNYIKDLKRVIGELEKEKAEREKFIAASPKTITLEMESEEFIPDRPSLSEATRLLPRRHVGATFSDVYRQLAVVDDRENILLPFQKRLAEYRDGLAAYVADIKDEDAADLNDFINQQKSAFIAGNLKRYIAAADFDSQVANSAASGPSTPVKVGELDDGRLLSYKVSMPPAIPKGLAGNGGGVGAGDIKDIGIFFIDEAGKSQRLVNYTLESGSASKLADIDFDNDGDADKLYSYGNNVFAKRNERKVGKGDLPVFRPVDVEIWTVFELMPKGGLAPNFPQVISETAHEVTFSFVKGELGESGLTGYEVIIKGNKSTKRVHLMTDKNKSVYAELKSISGTASFTGQKRDYAGEDDEKIAIKSGETIHPLEDSIVKFGAQEFTLSKGEMFVVPENAGNELEIKDGFVEIIRDEKLTQPAAAGMALTFGDSLKLDKGMAVISYKVGGDTVLYPGETYSLSRIEDVKNPTVSLPLDSAFYSARIYAFDSRGNRSNGSEKFLLAPQVCGDKTAPIANLGSASYKVAVGKTLTLDASRSFDSMSNVVSYWLDTDTSKDSDGDGDATNDKNTGGESPKLLIGPYDKVGQKKMRLVVQDEALNEGLQDITVDVITPRIVLDPISLKSNVISGFIDPPEENVPITIARLRQDSIQGWEVFKTMSADSGGQYYTNADGKFVIDDADLRDSLIVKNSENKMVAEIDSKSGRILILDPLYEMRLVPYMPPNLPTRLGIFFKSDSSNKNPLTYIYFTPDVNTDVAIDGQDVEYDEKTLNGFNGVHIKPLVDASESGVEFNLVPSDDQNTPGAVALRKNGKQIAIIDVTGNIFVEDQSIKLKVKENGKFSAPVVFEMLYDNKIIVEIFIAAHFGMSNRVEIVDAPSLPPRPKPIPVSKQTKKFSDIDLNDPFAEIIENLVKRGIVAGYPAMSKGELLFKPENNINRAEFTQITLKMLCIVPREEAKKLPSPFYDVLDEKLWFYPVLKEGNIRGFIKGYIGEAKNGIAPFKPANFITRAEAATVVLAALAEEDVIDLSKADFSLKEGEQWYAPYVRIAQDLKPYLKNPNDKTARAFLITADEAGNPDEQITRRDFAIMADRVLLMHDCYDNDVDDDGLPDSWERENGKEPNEMQPNDDPDNDKCTNLKEYEIGTNPFDPDTDKGGVTDCIELERGTNPVKNPFDDMPQAPASKNAEGIFVLRPSCGNVCPCRATIMSGADLQAGDILFAAITGKGGLPIYVKSNEEKY